jgi:hypothetical protein
MAMNPRGKGCLVAFAVVLAAIMALGWAFWGYKTTVRSRLSLVVETPEGERTGSSVSQVMIESPGRLNRAIGFSSLRTAGEEGEAVVVDLGSRGLLFATLVDERALRSGGMGMYNAGATPFPQERFRGVIDQGIGLKDEYTAYLDELNRRKPKGELPFKYLPMLVRFRDPSDPTSVERVDPVDLASSFGSGVRLKSAFVEITDDPLTRGIEARLPWVTRNNFPPMLISPPPGLRSLSETSSVEMLRYDDFRRQFP